MSVVESLPDTPLSIDQVNRLRRAPGVSCVHVMFSAGDPGEPGSIGELVLFLESGRAFAVRFEIERERWVIVDRGDGDHDDLLHELKQRLDATRGDSQEYGYALSLAAGLDPVDPFSGGDNE